MSKIPIFCNFHLQKVGIFGTISIGVITPVERRLILYLNCLVDIPDAKGKITFRNKSGTDYVYYEYGRDYDVLFGLADEMLYKAKQNGKHCGLAYSDAFIKESDTLDIEAELSRITKIITERNEGRGAFILGRDTFAAVYNFVMRFNKRYNAKALKILFVIEPASEDRASLDRIMDSFGYVLEASLRRSDVIMKNRGRSVLFVIADDGGIGFRRCRKQDTW